MRVALVTPVYPPYRGGIGSVAQQDAHELKARGFEVKVLTPDYGHERNPEATYIRSRLKLGNAAWLPGLLRALRAAELAHLHYPFYGAEVFVWLWSVLQRKPYVMTYHMQPKTSDWRNLVFVLHRWLIEPVIVRRAKAVFVSSLDYAQSIGLRHKHLIEMPFGVDEQRFSPGRAEAVRAAHNIPESSLVFVFVGGLDRAHSFKGVEVLLRAAARLSPEQDWRVLIVGEGELRTSYAKLAQALGLKNRVVFTGAVSEAELPQVYRASNVHVLPSTSRSEAFGLVTLEAAASGLPSLVSDLPGVRTLVAPAETGFIVVPGSETALAGGLQKFLDDPALAKKWGARARERILQGYTTTTLADRLVGVYNRITVSGEL